MSVDPSSQRTGAVRADEPRRRKRGLLWLLLALLALLLLIALAVVLYLALRDDDDPSAAAAPPSNPVSSPADPAATSGASSGAPSSGTAPSGPASAGAGTGTGTGAAPAGANGGLVGGAAIPPVAAAGGTSLATNGAVGTVLFAEDSAAIDARGQTVIADAVNRIRTAGAKQVLVSGYTDVVGGQPVNGSLSQDRADRVAAALRQQLGGGVTVTTAARGEADPVRPNDSAENRQFNRRATITLR